MAIETRSTSIGDNQYGMMTPAPTVAMPLANRVALLLGPLLSTLSKEADNKGWEVFTSVLNGVDPDILQKLFMDSVKAGRLCVNNKPIFEQIPFDQHFSDFKSDTYPACIWCMWECIRDFFPQLEGIVQKATMKAKDALSSPPDGK